MAEATQDPIITERLILRKLRPSDADAVFDMMRTTATMQYTMMPEEHQFAIARVDVENVSSLKLLERCGWTRGEVEERAYTSALLGVRDDVCFRIAREGY
ncbi:unnamed protein product, partial [Aureobasidium pullulans]